MKMRLLLLSILLLAGTPAIASEAFGKVIEMQLNRFKLSEMPNGCDFVYYYDFETYSAIGSQRLKTQEQKTYDLVKAAALHGKSMKIRVGKTRDSRSCYAASTSIVFD